MKPDDELALHIFLDDMLPCVCFDRSSLSVVDAAFLQAMSRAYGVGWTDGFDVWLKAELRRRESKKRLPEPSVEDFTSRGLRRLLRRLTSIHESIVDPSQQFAICDWARHVRDTYAGRDWNFHAWCSSVEDLLPGQVSIVDVEPEPLSLESIGWGVVHALKDTIRKLEHLPFESQEPTLLSISKEELLGRSSERTVHGLPSPGFRVPSPEEVRRGQLPPQRSEESLPLAGQPAAVAADQPPTTAPGGFEAPQGQSEAVPGDPFLPAGEPLPRPVDNPVDLLAGGSEEQAPRDAIRSREESPRDAPVPSSPFGPDDEPPDLWRERGISRSPTVLRPVVPAVDVSELSLDGSALKERLLLLVKNTQEPAWCRELIQMAPTLVANTWTARTLVEGGHVGFVSPGDEGSEVWFAGDIHGDLLALALLREAYEQRKKEVPDLRLAFLGDFVDRGEHDAELILGVLDWMREDDGRVGWIAGNHDLYLEGTAEAGFTTRVSPASFIDWLNARPGDHWGRQLGEVFAATVKTLPVALFLPGLLATHGGFPHVDVQPHVRDRKGLEDERCLRDFTNNRIGDKKKSIPNRGSHTSQFGYQDFFAFCNHMRSIGEDVEQIVRGHDHVDAHTARWERLSGYGNRVLTINSLSYNQEVIYGIPPDPRWPTVAVWKPRTRELQPVELHYAGWVGDWYEDLRKRVSRDAADSTVPNPV